MEAIGEDETAAASVGIHVTRFKIGITVLSAALTAVGGVAYAQYISYVNPDTLAGIGVSLRIVFAVVLGGMYSLLGPTVGTALTIALVRVPPRSSFGLKLIGMAETIYGLLLIIFIIFLPSGIYGSAARAVSRAGARRRRAPGVGVSLRRPWRTATIYPDKEPLEGGARAGRRRSSATAATCWPIYQEPVGEHWQIFCLLPRDKVEPSPYQRDVSPTHVKRLTEAVKKLDRFVDPIVAVSPEPGVYWTPNGNHRRDRARQAQGRVRPGHPGGRARGRLPGAAAQHREGPQPQGEVARGHPDVPRPGRAAADDHGGGLGVPVRVAPTSSRSASSTSRTSGSRAAPSRRSSAGWTSSSRASLRKGLEERDERAELVRAADEALGAVGGQGEEARHQPSLREELPAGAHDPAHPGAQDAAVASSRRSRSCEPTSTTST